MIIRSYTFLQHLCFIHLYIWKRGSGADYNSGQNFEDVVLKAVFEACEARGIDSLVQTRFDEAERLLSDWENKSGNADSVRNFYEDFIPV